MKIVYLFICLFFYTYVSSQNNYFGCSIGSSYSTLTGPELNPKSNQLGILIDARYYLKLSGKLSLQTGIGYSNNNAAVTRARENTLTPPAFIKDIEETFSINRFLVPVKINYFFNNNTNGLYVLLGVNTNITSVLKRRIKHTVVDPINADGGTLYSTFGNSLTNPSTSKVIFSGETGLGYNTTINNKLFFVEFTYSSDLTEWQYQSISTYPSKELYNAKLNGLNLKIGFLFHPKWKNK